MKVVQFISRCMGLHRSLRARLWRGGGLIFTFIVTIIAANCFVDKDRAITWEMLGHDFVAFYYGGTCVRTGHYEQLYDLSATRAFEFKTIPNATVTLGTSFGPWWNPPFAAWMFAPLSALPYLTALHVWWTIGLISLAISIFLMCRMLNGGWKTGLLVAMLVISSMPCIQAFGHAQNTFISLLLMTTTISLWRAGKSFLAGIVCGLLFYKPQLGAVVASVLCLCQGRRALLGLALTCTALVLVNVLTLPGTLKEFVFVMPQNLHWMQEEIVYRWARHITFKAFWRKAIQDDAVGPLSATVKILWGLCEAALLAGLLALIVKTRRGLDPACRRDRLISTTLIAMPLLMPFYFDYDLLLLSIGIAVYVADRERDGIPEHSANWEDRWLVRVFILFYVGLEFTLRSRIHPIVPLLSFATVLLIRRGLRPQAMPATASQPVLFPTALAA